MKTKTFQMERMVVWFTLLSSVGIVAIHLLAVIARRFLPDSPVSIWGITAGALIMAAFIAPFSCGIMPAWLDGTARKHPIKSVLFALLAILTIVQTARITANRINPENPMTILTSNEFWTAHECGTAYFHACELHDRGEENVYHADHYPVLNREIEPHTKFEGMKVEDAYQYPPQFLLLPKAMLLFTQHYPTLRVVWFALQFIGIAAVLLLLARWVGGTAGRWMAFLSPLVIVSPAALYAFQYTQFHFAAIALAIGGMVAFEKNHNRLGGALLAFAIVGKIFPGFLLILLLAEKRWKPLAWTGAFGLFYTFAALAVLGPEPFNTFLNYQIPRLQSFAAFAFLDVWPEIRFELITANLSPYGQLIRFGEMGIPGMTTETASFVNSLFMLGLILLTVFAAFRMDSRKRRAQVWLGVIGLASMTSPAAWGDYVPVAALWLLTALIADFNGSRRSTVLLGACGILSYFLLGVVPIGQGLSPTISYVLASTSFILLIAMKGWAVIRKDGATTKATSTSLALGEVAT